MAKNDAARADVVLAAGGIVWRDAPRGRELAVIHRPRYQDWTLPKGKLEPGERWQKGARREVHEETGFDLELGEFAGACGYMTRHAPKVVLYWHMKVAGDSRFAPQDRSEVDGIEWLTIPEALRKLTHVRERRMLAEATAPQGPPSPESSSTEVVTSPFRPPQTPEGAVTAKKPIVAVPGATPPPPADAVRRAAKSSRHAADTPQSRRGFLSRMLGSLGNRR